MSKVRVNTGHKSGRAAGGDAMLERALATVDLVTMARIAARRRLVTWLLFGASLLECWLLVYVVEPAGNPGALIWWLAMWLAVVAGSIRHLDAYTDRLEAEAKIERARIVRQHGSTWIALPMAK